MGHISWMESNATTISIWKNRYDCWGVPSQPAAHRKNKDGLHQQRKFHIIKIEFQIKPKKPKSQEKPNVLSHLQQTQISSLFHSLPQFQNLLSIQRKNRKKWTGVSTARLGQKIRDLKACTVDLPATYTAQLVSSFLRALLTTWFSFSVSKKLKI